MVKRSRVECAAVIDRPGDPFEIADKLSRMETERQIAAAASAVERWRKVVEDVAAGIDPDGATIDAIGELVGTLRLAPDSLASHVAAWREGQRLDEMCGAAAAELKETKARNQEIVSEIRELEQRLHDLRLEVQRYHATASGYPHLVGNFNEHRLKNPLLYGEPETVAKTLVKTTAAMIRPRAYAPVSSASWE